MYEPFFGLSQRPFLTTPDPDCFYETEYWREVQADIQQDLESETGFTVVTGKAGLGKTLLCLRTARQLGADWKVIFLDQANFAQPRDLLLELLQRFGVAAQGTSTQELRMHLNAAARNLCPEKRGLVILVDEAQLLPLEVLEELQNLSELKTEGRSLIQVILVGQPALTVSLKQCGLNDESTSLELLPLQIEESMGYVDYRLSRCGAETETIFAEDALKLAGKVSEGIPRCLNQLCDHALLLGYIADEKPLRSGLLQEALNDLRSLPMHWEGMSTAESSTSSLPVNSTAELNPPPRSDENSSASVPVEAPPASSALPSEPKETPLAPEFEPGDSTPDPEPVAPLPETAVFEVGAGVPSQSSAPWFQLLPGQPDASPEEPRQPEIPPQLEEKLVEPLVRPIPSRKLPGEYVPDRYARLADGESLASDYPAARLPAGVPVEQDSTAWTIGPLPDWTAWGSKPSPQEVVSDPWIAQPELKPHPVSVSLDEDELAELFGQPKVSAMTASSHPESQPSYTEETVRPWAELPADPTEYLLHDLPSEKFYQAIERTESPRSDFANGSDNTWIPSEKEPDDLLEEIHSLVDEALQETPEEEEPVAEELPAVPEPVLPEVSPQENLGRELRQMALEMQEEPEPVSEPSTPPIPAPKQRGRFSQLFTRLRQQGVRGVVLPGSNSPGMMVGW